MPVTLLMPYYAETSHSRPPNRLTLRTTLSCEKKQRKRKEHYHFQLGEEHQSHNGTNKQGLTYSFACGYF
jgi:hypothetical protein